MAGDRMRRVNEAVKEVLSVRISEGFADPRIGFVTVTGVETSPDLRRARVWVSVLGSVAERRATLEGLESAHGLLQARIAAELRLKRTPTLEFAYDESIARGIKYDDPDVGIEWPEGLELIPSERDRSAPLLREVEDELPFSYER